MTALAEGQGDMLWTVVYAITPNVNVTSKAAIAAGISHGNDGLELIEGMKVVTSTRERESRPLIVYSKSRRRLPFMEQPYESTPLEQKPWPYCRLTRLLLTPFSPAH